MPETQSGDHFRTIGNRHFLAPVGKQVEATCVVLVGLGVIVFRLGNLSQIDQGTGNGVGIARLASGGKRFFVETPGTDDVTVQMIDHAAGCCCK